MGEELSRDSIAEPEQAEEMLGWTRGAAMGRGVMKARGREEEGWWAGGVLHRGDPMPRYVPRSNVQLCGHDTGTCLDKAIYFMAREFRELRSIFTWANCSQYSNSQIPIGMNCTDKHSLNQLFLPAIRIAT